MGFKDLGIDELKKVAAFFVVDVEVADEDKGPNAKELVAALQSGDDPVTWKQYNEIYLPTQQANDEKPATESVELTSLPEPDVTVVEKAPVEQVLVKMERANPRYDVLGVTFTRDHPFNAVDREVAERIITNHEGFRYAHASEISNYYN